MKLQQRLLRAMLWMLGLSAAAGVLAVFLTTFIMGRVAGTALIAAIAIAAAMPISRMLDDGKKRVGGLVGLSSIIVSFIASLVAVWLDLVSPSWTLQWQMATTAVVVSIGGVIAGILLASLDVPWARWTVRVAYGADVSATILFLIAIWMRSESRPAETAGYVLGSGAAASLALLGIGIEPRPWRWLGVLASGVALALGIFNTWIDYSIDVTAYIISFCVAVVVAHAIVVLRVPMGEARPWALLAAIGSTVSVGACVSILAVITGGYESSGPDLLMRLTGAMGIISACSTLAVVVLYRLHRRPPGSSEVAAEITAIQLVCPYCGRRFAANIGESACAGCGLIITVVVREPRCEKCDYPTLGLQGSVCPECGTPRSKQSASRTAVR